MKLNMQIQEEHEFDEYNNSENRRTTPTNMLQHQNMFIIHQHQSSTKSNHKKKRSETECFM
jgi:hypothetical protein